MKKIPAAITVLTLITTSAHASWFGPSQEVIDLRNQLAQHHTNTLIIAGVLILCIIVAFIIGTMCGSRTRRNAQPTNADGQ